MQGHWLLARLGKRVLRPGGIGLTRRLLEAAGPTSTDRVIELGPGVGRTAEILLAARPASYKGVDPSPEGREQVADVLAAHSRQTDTEYVVADAASTGLPDGSADLVVGEAMLTIQSDDHKREIIAEAARILAPGGRYAIHELALRADRSPEELEEAAALDGASRIRTFVWIVLPVVRNGVMTVAILVFILISGEFLYAVNFLTDPSQYPLSATVAQQVSQYGISWSTLMAIAVIASIPTLIVFAVGQRALVRGISLGAVK